MPDQPAPRGICQLPGADPDWWFSGDHLTRSRAIDLCGTCILAIACLQTALAATPPVEGIWAGTTPRQRKVMKIVERAEAGQAA